MQQRKLTQITVSTKIKILLILLIPTLFLVFFGIVNNVYHIHNHKKLLVSNYSNELNAFLKDTEDKMTLIINSVPFIATNGEINYALTSSDKPNALTTSSIIYSLRQASSLLDIIDSVTIYNKTANFVITPTGVYDPDIYFNNIYPYSKYQHDYWSNLHSITGKTQILAPSVITSDTSSKTKTVVPLVFTSIGNIQSNNLVIFNINVNTIFSQFELHRLTPNSKLYMIDNSTGNIHSDISLDTNDNLEYTFIQSMESSLQSNTDTVSINKKKHLLIKSTQRSNSWGYTYLVTVPFTDISQKINTILLTSTLLMLILFAFAFLFLKHSSSQLYLPWLNLAKKINTTQDNLPKNITSYVSDSFTTLLDSNKSLKNNLEKVLPLSQEKYLINVLNNTVDFTNTDNDFLLQNFKYMYFAAISINITINSDFLAEQNTSASVMLRRIQDAIKSFFSEKFITYQLPGSKNIMYLLLNLDNDTYSDEILALIDTIKAVLNTDKDNLNVVFSYGKIYKGLDGLKVTHQESLSNMMHHLNSSEIQFSTSKSENIFSTNTENILKNYLTIGYIDKAKELLADIFNNFSNLSITTQKQVYSDIAACIKKILKQKEIQTPIVTIEYIQDIINNDTNILPAQIHESFFLILDKIEEHIQSNSKKIPIEEVIAYINEHYTENLFLDDLANQFNTSSKYLSKRIKQHLDVTFKDYITNLKIEKAKELLANTNITIKELFSQVGFQDRISFTRTFKQKTGVSPSEYKKNIHQTSQTTTE